MRTRDWIEQAEEGLEAFDEVEKRERREKQEKEKESRATRRFEGKGKITGEATQSYREMIMAELGLAYCLMGHGTVLIQGYGWVQGLQANRDRDGAVG